MPKPTNRFRRQLYIALENTQTNRPLQIALRLLIMGMIVVSIGSVILETVPALAARFGYVFVTIEIIAVAFFTVEYVARVWVSVEERAPGYQHPLWGRLRYMLTPMALIDLAAFLPSLITVFSDAGASWLAMRLLRLARMLKIMRYSPALRTLATALYTERRAGLAVLLIMLMVLVSLSTVMWMIERKAQPEAFGSIPAAMWWGMATLTTIGYGDVVPTTLLGKVVGSIAGLTGVAMFALPAAILASGFIRELNRQDFRVTFGVVSQVPLFEELDPNIIADVTDRLHMRHIPPRYAIIRRDEEPHALYFVETGQVEIIEPLKPARFLGPGQVFGAIELQKDSQTPQFTATALTDCRLLELPADDFIDLFQNYHELRQAVLRITRQDHDSLLFEKAEEAVREIEEAEQARIAEQERKLSEHEVSA